MTDNIDVSPSTRSSAVSVATDEVDNTHFPIYKLGIGIDGDVPISVSEDNPLPMVVPLSTISLLKDLLSTISTDIKINNAYLRQILGEKLTDCDIED